MKKPIIKNWIKYWSSVIAVSGLLVAGVSCGDSKQTAENEADRAETEVVAPVRENVAETTQEAEAETEEMAQTAQEESNLEFERTSNTQSGSDDMNASGIQDMDAHIEEHKEVNEKITEELTDANSQLQDGTTSDQQERSQYGEDGNINQTRGENPSQEMQPDQNQYTPQSNTTPDQPADETTPPENTNQNQQDLQGNDQQTGTVEYDTDQQGNTEMEMNDSQDQGTQQRSMDPTQQNESLDNKVNEQDTANVYDRQSNTMTEESPDAYLIIMETYKTSVDEESQEKYNEVIEDYKARRESMKGEKNPATGAYVSPDIDPMPSVGIDRLTEQIQDNIEYPQNAQAAEIQGTIFVNFVVDENGKVTEAKAIDDVIVPASSTTPTLNPTAFSENEIEEAKKEMMEEAVKAVEKTSGQWIPAQHEMQNVKAEVQLPVVFDIQRIGAAATDDPVDATQE